MNRLFVCGSLSIHLALAASGCSDTGGSDTAESSADTEESGDTEESTATTDASGNESTPTTAADETSAGEGSGNDTAGLDEVEEACEADCAAQYATDCTPPTQNELVCKLNCAVGTVQLGNFCLSEYATWVQCRADGGYDCVNGYPSQRSTCTLEQVAYSECTADLGCKRWCDESIEQGCETASFDACFDACKAEEEALPESCTFYANSIPLCQVQLGLICGVAEDPSIGLTCNDAIANVGDCLAGDSADVCTGYCYVTDAIGCGDACESSCSQRQENTMCGEQFTRLAECTLRYGDFVCLDGRLSGIDICDSEETAYQECLAGG